MQEQKTKEMRADEGLTVFLLELSTKKNPKIKYESTYLKHRDHIFIK